jgi:TonB-dependent receptor
LSEGVQAFSRQSDIQVIAAGDLSRKSNRRIRGALNPTVALSALIQGLGLRADAVAGGYILRPAAAPERADPPAPTELPELVVTGYRRSLRRAEAQKREAVAEEDAIFSEDIAAFPDLNLAESLQRIAGITITRDSGEGRQISLRGLGPDFARTQLNGMEVLGNTASGMDNRGSVSRTRSFDYSLFASELFDKVTVLKSYSADLDEGGIGGTVQLETAKPLDFPGFKGVLSAKGQENVATGSVTPRLAGLISDRWGPFGALASVAYSVNDSNEFGYRNWGWRPIRVDPANIGAAVSAADAALMQSGTIYAPQADTYSTWYDHRTRLGATLSLQYKPLDGLELGFDALYSRLTNDRKDYALAAAGVNALTGDVSGAQVLQSDVIRGNTLIAAAYTGVDLRSESNTESDSTAFSQEVLHGAWRAGDRLLLKGQVGSSRSDYELPYFDKVFLESKNQAFGFNDQPSMPVNTYGFNTNDPSQWNLMRLDTQANRIISAYTNARFDAIYTLNGVSSLEGGVEYRRFSNRGAQYNDKVFYDSPADTPIPAKLKLSVPYGALAPYVVGDVGGTYAYIGQTRNIESPAFLSPGSNYSVVEATTAVYLQYNLDARLWDWRVKANAGLRYYATGLTSAGSLKCGAGLAPVFIHHTYDGVLPAANLAVYVKPDLVVRLSANRDISRPALSSLAAAGTITTAPFGGSLTIGNPDLKPFTADEVEGSIEWYEGRVGFFSAGVFYKKLNAFISSETTVEPYSATGYPLSFLLPGQTGSTPFNVSHPVNVDGAGIKGVELAAQRDFDFLPAPFNHLGLAANATYADGASPAVINGVSHILPLTDLSKYSANATLYYETARWGVRISEAYRSQYLDSTGANGDLGEGYLPTHNVDVSAHYNITPQLKATLEAVNLTNQHIVQFTDLAAKRPEVDTSSGTTLLWGLTAEF